jgi:hypothetical protein
MRIYIHLLLRCILPMAPYEDYSQIHQPSPTDEEEECASIGHAVRELWYYVRIHVELQKAESHCESITVGT